MPSRVTTSTPSGVMKPIGPYSHIAKADGMISISAIAGVDPATGELAGPDVQAQTRQIIASFDHLLASAGSDLDHILHITVFLLDMADFADMNDAYVEVMGERRPARSVIAVSGLPKQGARLTMNVQAVSHGGFAELDKKFEILSGATIVPVRDVEVSVSFYRDVLGFDVRFAAPDGSIAIVGRGPAVLQLLKTDDENSLRATATNIAVYIEVKGLDALFEELRVGLEALPQERLRMPFEQPYGMREFHVKDPDGCLLFFGEDT